MVREFFHICRTYFITFRYIKKNEIVFLLIFFWIALLIFIF